MNYIGSKYSLMDFLTETIVTVAGTDTDKIFADLFAGTGVVGKTFKQNGYQVIANDIQHYSYVTNKHFIENVLYCKPLNCDGMTVGEFADMHPRGIYLVRMEQHISCIINNTIYDIFDCRNH